MVPIPGCLLQYLGDKVFRQVYTTTLSVKPKERQGADIFIYGREELGFL